MPVVVAEALVYIWPSLLAAIGTAGVTVLSYAIVIGAFYAYSTYQARAAKQAAKDAFNSTLQDRLVMTTTTDAPRSRLYGRVRNVDGVLFKNTHGALNQFYTFVVAIAGHEIDAFEDYWFADLKVTLDGSGYVQEAPYNIFTRTSDVQTVTPVATSGSFVLPHVAYTDSVSVYVPGATAQDPSIPVTFTLSGSTVSYSGVTIGVAFVISYQWASGKSYARIRSYKGAAGQDLSTDLIALGVPDITTADKFEGIACLLVTLEFSTDAFPQGVPGMSATVRGAKVLDPRSSTTAWSENPALCAYDWALYPYGGNAATTEIQTSTVISAANACDVSHTFHTDTHGDVPMALYTCGIVAATKSDPTQTLNELVAAMAGKFAWVGGILFFKAGAYTAPVATIDETWLSGQQTIEIVSGIPRANLVNVYRPSIADSTKGYVVTPTQPVVASAYVTLDGEELAVDVTFMAITDPYHAQNVSGVLLKDARQGLTVKLPCNLKAYPLEVFDTVAVTLSQYGWSAKEFELLTWEFSETGGVQAVMKETTASIFDPAALFTTSDDAPNTGLPLPWFVPSIAGLTASSGTVPLDDGSISTRTKISWTPSTALNVIQSGSIEIQIANVFTGVWQSVYTEGAASSVIVPGLLGNVAYIIRARAITSAPLMVKSDWSTQIAHVVAAPADVVTDWTDLPGRPMIYRAISRGNDDTSAPLGAALYDETGTSISGAARSYTVNVFSRSTGLVIASNTYDVYGGGGAAAALAANLNSRNSDVIVLVRTYDEPSLNRLTGGMDAAMYRCGASKPIFGKPTFASRGAYVMIGIGGCGEGNGYEAYADYSVPTRAFCDVSFMIKGGNLIVTGSGATPLALVDYNYVGTLNATTDLALVARGNCVLAGNLGTKLGGTSTWDSDIYSLDSVSFAGYASAIAGQSTADVMFGLNSDPTTDSSYTSLDYAMYFAPAGVLYAYESGVGSIIGTYAAGDVGIVLYDGSRVRYMLNGVTMRTVSASPGLTFFFDTSFYTPNCFLRNMRFGALSANDWANIGGVSVATGQIQPSAATDVFTDNHDFAGGAFGNATVRSFVVTPAVNCVVEFTAGIWADNIDGDSGSSILWKVTPAGGGTTVIGATNSSAIARAQFIASNAFLATGGVALTFDIVTAKGGFTNVHLFESQMRVTLVKR